MRDKLKKEALECKQLYEAIAETRAQDKHNHYMLHYDTHAETADLIARQDAFIAEQDKALRTLLEARRIKGTPEYEAMKKHGWELAEAAVKDADNS